MPAMFRYFGVFQRLIGNKIYLILFLTFLASVSESFGIVLLIPLFEVMFSDNAVGLIDYGLPEWLLNDFQNTALFFGVPVGDVFLISIVAMFLIKGSILFIALMIEAAERANLIFKLKSELFNYYEGLTHQQYISGNKSNYLNLIIEQTNRALNAFKAFSQFFSHLISSIIYVCLALLLSPSTGVIILSLGLIVAFCFRKLNRHVRLLSVAFATENSRLEGLVMQFLDAFKYLVATSQKIKLRSPVLGSIKRLSATQRRLGTASAFTQAVREPVGVSVIAVLLLVSTRMSEIEVGVLVVTLVLFYRAFNSIMNVQIGWQGCLEYIGSLEAVNDELIQKKPVSGQTLEEKKLDFFNSIELKNVNFSFNPDSDDSILREINLKINKNTVTAIVGPSGAGKSTLIDIITLILKPVSGFFLIDGVCSSDIDKDEWRRNVGLVTQRPVVFNDTLQNNVCMWEQDTQTTKRKVEAALKSAGFNDDVLPRGLETIIGEGGANLSGGQIQRVQIARELYRSKQLLILDEATSSLDYLTESVVQDSIRNLRKNTTILLIAHRLSTVRIADNIIYLENGRIVEAGSYSDLVQDGSTKFAKLVKSQEHETSFMQ